MAARYNVSSSNKRIMLDDDEDKYGRPEFIESWRLV